MSPLDTQGVNASPPPLAGSSPAGASALADPSPAPRTVRPAVPTPSLKPTEFITWVKFDRPKFALGEILVGSLAFVGMAFVLAVAIGILLGHFKSKRRGTTGTTGLGLR